MKVLCVVIVVLLFLGCAEPYGGTIVDMVEKKYDGGLIGPGRITRDVVVLLDTGEYKALYAHLSDFYQFDIGDRLSIKNRYNWGAE